MLILALALAPASGTGITTGMGTGTVAPAPAFIGTGTGWHWHWHHHQLWHHWHWRHRPWHVRIPARASASLAPALGWCRGAAALSLCAIERPAWCVPTTDGWHVRVGPTSHPIASPRDRSWVACCACVARISIYVIAWPLPQGIRIDPQGRGRRRARALVIRGVHPHVE
ncbi:hypothetical protein EDB86DRAFT_2279094 [Lactarius hatsudake]|nr:hypothetical protein EDB86DRAFT_2279094 [Lactarius hatsudake]